jgi:hypothetical protein
MIQTGTKLGRYEIRSKLGGGTEDTEIHRKVAFSKDGDHITRAV